MMVSKGELFAKLGEILDDNDIRFAFAGEEFEVKEVEIGASMEEAWIILYPKAETPDQDAYFVGRNTTEPEPYVGKHRK